MAEKAECTKENHNLRIRMGAIHLMYRCLTYLGFTGKDWHITNFDDYAGGIRDGVTANAAVAEHDKETRKYPAPKVLDLRVLYQERPEKSRQDGRTLTGNTKYSFFFTAEVWGQKVSGGAREGGEAVLTPEQIDDPDVADPLIQAAAERAYAALLENIRRETAKMLEAVAGELKVPEAASAE